MQGMMHLYCNLPARQPQWIHDTTLHSTLSQQPPFLPTLYWPKGHDAAMLNGNAEICSLVKRARQSRTLEAVDSHSTTTPWTQNLT